MTTHLFRGIKELFEQIRITDLDTDLTQPSQEASGLRRLYLKRDREHLKLLSIFHFVFGGLALAGIGFLFVHYFIMHTAFSNPDMWKSQPKAMPPKAFLDAFIWFCPFMGLMLLIGLVRNVLSGLFRCQKTNRLFSLIVAGLNCVQIPFGTALGVFTILVLSRDSVRQLYSERAVI
jgi:hypothetical protein